MWGWGWVLWGRRWTGCCCPRQRTTWWRKCREWPDVGRCGPGRTGWRQIQHKLYRTTNKNEEDKIIYHKTIVGGNITRNKSWFHVKFYGYHKQTCFSNLQNHLSCFYGYGCWKWARKILYVVKYKRYDQSMYERVIKKIEHVGHKRIFCKIKRLC